jgi:DNA-directed DNA polymerase III PolC
MGYIHLHCRSAYSLLEGTATPQSLVGLARRYRMPALALTDRNNLYGAVPFYIHAQKAGVKPLIGMEVEIKDWGGDVGMEQPSTLVLLARNMDSYRNLCHLATVLRLHSDPETYTPAGFDEEGDEEILPWDEGAWGVPVFGFTPRPQPARRYAPPAQVQRTRPPGLSAGPLLSGRHVRGLIALSGGRRGLVNRLVAQGKIREAAKAAGMLVAAFGAGNFFIELAAVGAEDMALVAALADLANSLGIPIVATNEVLYGSADDARTALALAAARTRSPLFREAEKDGGIPDGGGDLREDVGSERYLKSADQMAELFSAYPQAIANSLYIAGECNVELPINRPLLPTVGLRGAETVYSRLWKLAFAGATRRYRPLTEPVTARLKHELEIIEGLGFSAYFLAVYEIARFAHARDIPTMARGSAASSLVTYALGITQVDPLAHGLLFERFLNPSRAEFSLPDIDLDICWRRRDEVLRFVYDTFGRDHVAIVGTHITFRPRSAWREMAKVFGVDTHRTSYIASRLADVVPGDAPPDGTDAEAVDDGDYQPQAEESAPDLKLRDEKEREAYELALAIEGLPRHAGMHCGGVVITPAHTPIADLIPLQRAARDPSLAITQYDKDAIESLGLVKMDLLGSRALTALVDALSASGLAHGKGRGDVAHALDAIPFGDQATYRMMAAGETLGCFQLESPGMRALLKWMRPNCMADVAASISLFRPGPLEGGFLERFMRRHLQQEAVAYPHPSMEGILQETKGIILYQEQFLRLAHELAGLTLGEAERLRKDLGKAKGPEERARLGVAFVAGAIERGIDQLQAEAVWAVVVGYSGFGFCKAHAVSYALTAYRSAYMKAHHPAEFMAAVVNNGGGYYGPAVYLEDARRLRITLLPPDVNLSGAWCEVPPRARAIRLGLQFVKGLSEGAIAAIVAARHSGEPFASLPDLLARVDMSDAEIASLVKVGACDSLGLEDVSALTPILGEAGEVVGTIYGGRLNRKQMMWLLPSLLSLRSRKARGTFRRAGAGGLGLEGELQATGSYGGATPMQMLMGEVEVAMGGDSPRVLGAGSQHLRVPGMDDFTPIEKLRLEREALGFAVSRNMMELYADAPGTEGVVPGSELSWHAGREVTVAGVIVGGRSHTTRAGERMLFCSLQDATGLVEVVLFPEAYKACRATLANGGQGPYIVRGRVQVSGTGRGVGTQPPQDLRPTDAVSMRMHLVLIAGYLEPLVCT